MITTKWEIKVYEYDRDGYYYPVYSTNVTVISDTKEDALQKAIDRVPKRSGRSCYVQNAKVLTFEDVVLKELEE